MSEARDKHVLAKRLLALFLSTFAISLTTNTGYAILAAMKESFVSRRGWFTEEEMADYVALAQSAPGPMAINASVVIGQQAAGTLGSCAAVLGCALPPFLAMVAVSYFYQAFIDNWFMAAFMRGMQVGVVAMLLDVVITLFCNVTRKGLAYPCLVMLVALAYVRLTGWSILWLAIGCALAGVARVRFFSRKTGGDAS